MSGEDRGSDVYAKLGLSLKHILKEDENSKAMKYALERWDDLHKLQVGRAEQKRRRVIDAKTELYQMVSLYILCQGLILSTVIKAVLNFNCVTASAPALFSALVSGAACFGLRDRLIYYYGQMRAVESEEAKAKMTMRKIHHVLSKGPDFDFAAMDKLDLDLQPRPPQDSGDGETQPLLQRRVQKGPVEYYYIMGSTIFSAIVIFACFFILYCF